MTKVKVTVPYMMNEKIEEDKIYFELPTAGLGNKIISYYKDKEVEKSEIKSEKGERIQFNLNKENDEIYSTILKEHKVEVDAEFLRDLFYNYLNNPRYVREEILFDSILKNIKSAISENRKINIKYNNKIRTVNPYLIKTSAGEDRSYLFCYCEENNEYRNYRIANIELVTLSKHEIEYKDKEYIKQIDKNFDPFLSYGKKVVVRMSSEGEMLYKRALANRPKLMESNGDIWTFQCDVKLAQVYFPQFLSKVEILEPVELKEWFKKEYEEILKKY